MLFRFEGNQNKNINLFKNCYFLLNDYLKLLILFLLFIMNLYLFDLIIIIIIIIIIIVIIELTLGETILENTLEIEPQPVALDFKNLSQYSSRSK